MMENKICYDEHFLMNEEDIKDYVVARLGLFDDKDHLVVSEIGDGNINYVHQVTETSTGKTVVVKQADKYLRSSGRLLDLSRNRIEAEILKIQNELAPEFIPEVFDYDENMSALTMENISEYRNMRYELIDKKIFPNFSQEITNFLAKVLLPTTDLVLDSATKKTRVKSFTNIDMCDISENLVLTEPYDDYRNQNIITSGNEKFVESTLYEDEELHAEIAWLRNNFMNNDQALIHGDLHTGSIFINQLGVKIIDPEFACYGPMGYDIGNVLAHLYFPLVLSLTDENTDTSFNDWILISSKEIYNLVLEKMNILYDEIVTNKLYKNESFKKSYLANIMNDTLGYAGTEIIRRVVGDSKVKELSLIPEEKKVQAERVLINFGVQLIKERKTITTGQDLVDAFIKCKEGI
ncbi:MULTISPECIES: S-methyl-5-thioribose kinase [Enterococcus]|jgi:5-methylthioribose kinase|uniref:S-methyl-5-thioribose kinase n=1 Tax=Enterococcus raffinosus TaxID=71452 RepID=A0AAW8TEJ5_9ENTE|nr:MULTISPECIES: S-methyl-5-thioribose kinase [Enterococcus]SAM73214.1 Methylthioribose kinase [Enterococcus faecium]MBS6432024.1 S-methyl-5-thioribose kinase [Enterococcus raffinosus]MDK7992973.1 S-methyl-5-thioribose kinase [Enterococcus raffinosus]MDT2524128.1 S-methyl-5-thioribose kinase [Enterococcus raffinosus]MDT2534891.1 S-methyl-5-thioribose kinase [Enterococcus raffinosus]